MNSNKIVSRLLRTILFDLYTGDDSLLRSIPEGRKWLLDLKREERRTIPLFVRRAPRLAGRTARRIVEKIAFDILTGKEK